MTFSYSDNDRSLMKHSIGSMRSVLDAAGAKELWVDDDTSHLMGGCRMGDDPEDSVVNKDGRSWSIPNLWVCDGSLFPTSGGVNPSLTIQALACRMGDRIAEHGDAGRAMRKAPGNIASIEDLRKRAHARVPKPFMDYLEAAHSRRSPCARTGAIWTRSDFASG